MDDVKESRVRYIKKRTDGGSGKNSKEERDRYPNRMQGGRQKFWAGSGNNGAAAFLIVGHFVATLV